MDMGLILVILQWRYNGRDGASNHQPHDCLLNRLFRRRSKKTSKFRVTGLCTGNRRGPVNCQHKWPVTRKMFPFHDVIMMWDFPRTLRDMLYVFHVPDTKATQVPQIAKFMGLTWGPHGPHAGLTNLAIRVVFIHGRRIRLSHIMNTMVADDWATQGAHQELC